MYPHNNLVPMNTGILLEVTISLHVNIFTVANFAATFLFLIESLMFVAFVNITMTLNHILQKTVLTEE